MNTNVQENKARLGTSPRPQEWIRLPRAGNREPITGLSRSTLCELTLPCAANGRRPPVKSAVLKKCDASRGIRLIHLKSLLSHLDALAAKAEVAFSPIDDKHGKGGSK